MEFTLVMAARVFSKDLSEETDSTCAKPKQREVVSSTRLIEINAVPADSQNVKKLV